MRVIHLPAVNKTVTLKEYVAAIKMAKANPDAEFNHGLSCWWSCTGREIMHQFRSGMMDRINDNIPYRKRGVDKDESIDSPNDR